VFHVKCAKLKAVICQNFIKILSYQFKNLLSQSFLNRNKNDHCEAKERIRSDLRQEEERRRRRHLQGW